MFTNKINLNNIFLLDSIGAFASTVFTGLILPLFFQQIGIDKSDLYLLASVAFVYSIYSFFCYKLSSKPGLLLTIIAANLLYCFITLSLIFFYKNLTLIGKALFSLEVLIILIVIAIEFKVYIKDRATRS